MCRVVLNCLLLKHCTGSQKKVGYFIVRLEEVAKFQREDFSFCRELENSSPGEQ